MVMLLRARCSICHLSFNTVRALFEHRAGHAKQFGEDGGPAALLRQHPFAPHLSRTESASEAVVSTPRSSDDGEHDPAAGVGTERVGGSRR
jgi:hypothetical protein